MAYSKLSLFLMALALTAFSIPAYAEEGDIEVTDEETETAGEDAEDDYEEEVEEDFYEEESEPIGFDMGGNQHMALPEWLLYVFVLAFIGGMTFLLRRLLAMQAEKQSKEDAKKEKADRKAAKRALGKKNSKKNK